METRSNRYKDINNTKSRVEKNQPLYKMIYTAYDEYENYKIPIDSNEIDLTNIKKNVTSRDEYMRAKHYSDVTNRKVLREDKIEDTKEEPKEEVYDIKELLDKVKKDNLSERKTNIQEEKYLDKLHLNKEVKTNLDTIKEMYEDISLDSEEEEKLSNTANLSLEILSDLKSNDDTMVTPPMKEEPDEDDSFYSDSYNFDKKDFYNEDEENDEDEEFIDEDDNKFSFKILIIIALIVLITIVAIYLIKYFC